LKLETGNWKLKTASMPSRRDFLKGAVAAPIALPMLSAAGQNNSSGAAQGAQTGAPQRKIGYCIVGLGRISMGEFMPAVAISQTSKLVAFVSGHRDKAERMAAKYGVSTKNIYDYQNYDSIANNPEIDAVYIALPNAMHAEYTIRAARAGKHVLSEKPMANSVADCEQMIAACRQANRKLMIAYRCRYEPANLRAIELIQQGYIGELQIIESSFGFNEKKGEWRLDKKMAGGGPLVDVGIYSLQACRYLSGQEPTEVRASWSVRDHDGRFDTVEEYLAWNMQFPNGVLANCTTSYGYAGGNWARATGSKGWLMISPAFTYSGLKLHAEAYGQQPIDFVPDDPEPRQFLREADHFADCILNNREPKTPGEEGLRDERIITAIYQSCAEDRVIKL
jgi:predicted dehydrogenase